MEWGMSFKMAKNNIDDITRDMLGRIRSLEESATRKSILLTEEVDKEDMSENGIAITDDPVFGQNTLTSQIEQFRTSVESGAEFSKPDNAKVSESPLIYMPKTNNLVFSGVIPCLNNLKWQFVLRTNTGNGCFIWADGLILNKENMAILNKLQGFYTNWREQWNTEASELEKMADHLND